MDSDDFLYPNHLEEAVKYIEANSNPEIIRFNYDVVDSERNVLQVAKIPDEINEKITLGNFIGCSGIMAQAGCQI